MSQWITPAGSVGSREAGSIPHFSLKLASFLTEGRQLAGALFFCPGQVQIQTFTENSLFVPGRLRNIACLAGPEDRTEGALFWVGFDSISKGVIERRLGRTECFRPLQVSLSFCSRLSGGKHKQHFFSSFYPSAPSLRRGIFL